MYEMKINDPGLQSTLQDLGRWGFQSKGYSVGGAFDQFALKAANLLVGNDPGEAGIEMMFKGMEITFPCKTVVAMTGADMKPSLNGRSVDMWTSYVVKPGDTLKMGMADAGLRAYLSVRGGFLVTPFLGSKSISVQETVGSCGGTPLKKGSVLPIRESVVSDDVLMKRIAPDCIPDYYRASNKEIRVVAGNFDDQFTQKGIETFYNTEFIVGNDINRVGYRLEGETLEQKVEAGRLISTSMTTGSIQVPGGGQPIILCVERRTHGGYPVIATVVSVDIAKVAQCQPGDRIRFKKVSLEEAHRLLREREAVLRDSATFQAV